jgi:8-oxo-dGTP pyrophosphatase MutT (NUDIX family)
VGRIAAVRELFEETGLLLSDPSLDFEITHELRESVQSMLCLSGFYCSANDDLSLFRIISSLPNAD